MIAFLGVVLATIGYQLVYAGLLAVLAIARDRQRGRLDRADPRFRTGSLVAIVAAWLVGNIFALSLQPPFPATFFILTTLVILLVVGRELQQFWEVGLHGADRRTKDGLDYKRALQLCRNELAFLGTGAAKLTGQGATFRDAVVRCQRIDRPVRFLLLHPESGAKGLEDAARQAGFDRGEYLNRVRKSLRELADLGAERRYNLEVRFYTDPVPFRLMFIDRTLCLVSYNVYGEGDGSQLPQLHVVAPSGRRDVDSFYYAFHDYFEGLWDQSDSWEPRKWL